MKKNIISFGLIGFSVLLFSCNNDKDSSTTTSDTSTTTTTGVTVDTSMTTPAPTTTMSTTPLGESDKKFVMEAASGGMMEVELGRLAEQNASDPRVKNFGTMMVRDHSNANTELKALASAKSTMLTDSLMAKHKMHMDNLRKKTGKDFDKAYMSMMVQDHMEDVSKFQMAANKSMDADLKAFANKTLPVLRVHLDSAKAISKH
jgi:putative membrane protein